jgi:hypothetical protein
LAEPIKTPLPGKRQIARATPVGSPITVAAMLADRLTVRERLTICQNSREPNAAQSVATSVKARLGDHEVQVC